MALAIPHLVVSPAAPDYVQHLTSDANDIFNRIGTTLTELEAADASLEAELAALSTADLSDCAAGTWTPTFTFATPGDLAFTYAEQVGLYKKVGTLVFLSYHLTLSAFTHTTAAGIAQITGVPFPPGADEYGTVGLWAGITLPAGYTQVSTQIFGSPAVVAALGCGSASAAIALGVTHFLSGSNKTLRGSAVYSTT